MMWPSLNLLRISASSLISLAIGSFFSDENGSSRTRKTYGKAIHLSIAKKPPRFHGRKRRLPSSEAGHAGLPAYEIALTYAPRDSLRSSSDSGNLTCLWKCRGIYIGGWSMMTYLINFNYLFKTGSFRCHFWLPKRAGPAILTEGGKSWYSWWYRQPMQSWQTHGFPTSTDIFIMISCLIMPGNIHKSPPKEE